MHMRKLATTVLFLSLLPCGVMAARLMLRDGSVIVGRFVSGSPESIVFQDDTGMRRTYDLRQVQTIDFNDMGRRADQDRDRRSDRFAELPQGTQISVRTDQAINSRNADPGQSYPASIALDVVGADGRVVIPRGSPATLVIRQVNEGGALTGGNLLLDLDTVQVNGRQYRVASTDVKANNANGLGANKRTGEMVGGGAALGTVLGAIAGGGKGAAIGAAAGAVAGGGTEVLTKGREIRVPAESVLNFQLERSLELREAR
jgi:hypothetical protein